MSSPVLFAVGAILVCAGLLSVIAAVMGNPIRLGRLRMPGPDGPVERAVAAILGAVAFAAIAPVVILGLTQPPPPDDPYGGPAQNLQPMPVTSVPSTTVVTEPTATATPPPRTASASPGQKAATAVTVSLGAVTGCSRTASANVQVSNGPATVSYAIYINGVARSPAPSPVTGSGLLHLANTAVSLVAGGKVEYRILTPNLLSDSKTWTAGTGCGPSLSISGFQVDGDCSTAFTTSGTLTVGGTTNVDVTYQLLVTGGSTPAAHSVNLPPGGAPLAVESIAPGTGPMTFTYHASSGALSADSSTIQQDCTVPPA